MSAYSDWKCGAMSDDEYRDYCSWEARQDKYLEDKMFAEVYIDEEDCEDEDYE